MKSFIETAIIKEEAVSVKMAITGTWPMALSGLTCELKMMMPKVQEGKKSSKGTKDAGWRRLTPEDNVLVVEEKEQGGSPCL